LAAASGAVAFAHRPGSYLAANSGAVAFAHRPGSYSVPIAADRSLVAAAHRRGSYLVAMAANSVAVAVAVAGAHCRGSYLVAIGPKWRRITTGTMTAAPPSPSRPVALAPARSGRAIRASVATQRTRQRLATTPFTNPRDRWRHLEGDGQAHAISSTWRPRTSWPRAVTQTDFARVLHHG
jgi:hypothetical protein